tara:strand:- start:1679 stop:1870 length:192 start_codon:yes stop_codon:yes gene_type:complete
MKANPVNRSITGYIPYISIDQKYLPILISKYKYSINRMMGGFAKAYHQILFTPYLHIHRGFVE